MNSDQIEAARALIEIARALIAKSEDCVIEITDDYAQELTEAADTLETYLGS